MDLVRLEGRAASDRFQIYEEQAVIGRAPECDVVVFDPGASRRHARLRRSGSTYLLEDLQEANPSIVNDRTLEGTRRLDDGDLIVVGGVVFMVELDFATPHLEADIESLGLTTVPLPTPARAFPILPHADVKPSEATRDIAHRLDAAARRLQSRASALAPRLGRGYQDALDALEAILTTHESLGGDEELARLAGILRERLANQTDIRALYRLGAETEALVSWMQLSQQSIAETTKLAAALDLR